MRELRDGPRRREKRLYFFFFFCWTAPGKCRFGPGFPLKPGKRVPMVPSKKRQSQVGKTRKDLLDTGPKYHTLSHAGRLRCPFVPALPVVIAFPLLLFGMDIRYQPLKGKRPGHLDKRLPCEGSFKARLVTNVARVEASEKEGVHVQKPQTALYHFGSGHFVGPVSRFIQTALCHCLRRRHLQLENVLLCPGLTFYP